MAINTNYDDGMAHLVYVKSRLASNSMKIISPNADLVKRKMVTHTGFEPMLTA